MPRIYLGVPVTRQWVDEETLYASPHWEGNGREYTHPILPILYFVKNKRWILVTPDVLCGPNIEYEEISFEKAVAWLRINIWPRNPYSVPAVAYRKIKELENQEWVNS